VTRPAGPRRERARRPDRGERDTTARKAGPKSDATRKKLLDRALKLFQQRGVEGTTMRDIARAAGLSLGAAYYYFPSKEALMFAYYEANQTELEARAERATGSTRDRLGADFHAKLTSVRAQRRMLAALVGRLIDPGDPLSALSAQQRAVRERAITVLASILSAGGLSPGAVRLAASALWMLQMAALLLYVHDESPDQARTHRLVDDALDLVVPMLPILDTPLGRGFGARIVEALDRAGIALPALPALETS
jgi:AcrR family transcriptional regulator